MSYTDRAEYFTYRLDIEKEKKEREKLLKTGYEDAELEAYIIGIAERTMNPGLSIRRIIYEKYCNSDKCFQLNDYIIEKMPAFEECVSEEDFQKYKKALKVLADYHGVKCAAKQCMMWIKSPHSYSITRETLFKIAFILGLDHEETEGWLKNKLVVQGFNFRDVTEVIYEFSLRNGLTFAECEELQKECRDILAGRTKKDARTEDLQSTVFLKDELVKAVTKEELKLYIEKSAEEFVKVSNSRKKEFEKLCEEARNTILRIGTDVYRYDYTREDAVIENTNRMLGNMLVYGKPIVKDKERGDDFVEDERISDDILKNKLGAQRISGICKSKINVERKDILWLRFFIRALEIQYATELGKKEFKNMLGYEKAEQFEDEMADYLPELDFGEMYLANPFDNIVFYSLMQEKPYTMFLSLLDEKE